ncbi:MAG: serine--tRNA ligase [Azospirillum sp.]|nr:serine--tRNA ligase [Azospirillum sp.]
MFDLRFIRDYPVLFDRGMIRRGLSSRSVEILGLDSRRRAAQTELQTLQQQRNDISKQIGLAKREGRDTAALTDRVTEIKETLSILEIKEKVFGAALDEILANMPNLPADDVPDGADAEANVELRRWGNPPAIENPLEHFDLGEKLALMDFSAAAKLSGARFTVLKGGLARLERALGQFMIDFHTTEHGYTEVSPPLMVRDGAAFGTGQLPKFAEDLFKTTSDHWLIPTAEVPLTNLVAEQILDQESLPLRLTALTPCFRAEAGAAGKDTRGMIRQHQFWKVEMVSITAPEQSADEHERMTGCAEAVLQRLGLPYRVIVLSTGDMGFCAAKTYDIEVWLPGQSAYREISSCSNCGDFQARRMKARCRPRGTKEAPRAVHTLNGSGVAVGRCLIAVMENYQQPDGSILVPDALRRYMGGQERIAADA